MRQQYNPLLGHTRRATLNPSPWRQRPHSCTYPFGSLLALVLVLRTRLCQASTKTSRQRFNKNKTRMVFILGVITESVCAFDLAYPSPLVPHTQKTKRGHVSKKGDNRNIIYGRFWHPVHQDVSGHESVQSGRFVLDVSCLTRRMLSSRKGTQLYRRTRRPTSPPLGDAVEPAPPTRPLRSFCFEAA